jgi:hypothetical protein
MLHQVHGRPQLHLPQAQDAPLKGVITIEGSFKQAHYCEQDYVAQAATLVTPYAPNSPSHDAGRALVEEAAKAAAVLDQPSIDKAVKTSGDSSGFTSPSIQVLGSPKGADPIEVSYNFRHEQRPLLSHPPRSDTSRVVAHLLTSFTNQLGALSVCLFG